MNTNYGDEQQFKKSDAFKNAHNIHIHTGGDKSLKNTKINYTKDLLRHFLLIFWEDFASFLCVLQVSVLAKSVVHSLQILSSVTLCPLQSVSH